jgi:hypothetical protein
MDDPRIVPVKKNPGFAWLLQEVANSDSQVMKS